MNSLRGTNGLRLLARLLLGSTFAILGWEAAREPGPRVGMAARTLDTLRTVLPLPRDNELIVRANGAAQAAGGAMLAFGVLPRPAAALLVASLVPTTIAGHSFWSVDDASGRKMQRIQFQKNLAMLGGLLLVLGDVERRSRSGQPPRGQNGAVDARREYPKNSFPPRTSTARPITPG